MLGLLNLPLDRFESSCHWQCHPLLSSPRLPPGLVVVAVGAADDDGCDVSDDLSVGNGDNCVGCCGCD